MACRVVRQAVVDGAVVLANRLHEGRGGHAQLVAKCTSDGACLICGEACRSAWTFLTSLFDVPGR